MEEGALRDVCPACGVPKTAFVEHKFSVSEKRWRILDLHLHPISVHFPETISVFSVPFLLLSLFTSGALSSNLLITTKVLSIIFPLTVLTAIATGIYDGKVRFKKLSPPYLKVKISIGIVLLISSIFTLVVLQIGLNSTILKAAAVLLCLNNLSASVVLGKIGGKLIDSKMPG